VLRGAESDGAASAQRSTAIAGYAHPSYAKSFSEFATPVELPHCGGWALERTIAGSGLRDAMGCYPIFAVVIGPASISTFLRSRAILSP
jgi:hypothetical protein